MVDRHAIEILGLADASIHDAASSLATLGADHDIDAHTAPRRLDAGTWLSLTALPTGDGTVAGPFLDVLRAANGGLLASLQVLVLHSEQTGTRIWLSAGHPQLRDRMRRQLAPACDVSVADPPQDWRRWPSTGLRFRLQPETGDQTSAGQQRAGVLERLTSVEGDWGVLLDLSSVHPVELRDARQAALALAARAADSVTSTRQEASTRSVTVVSAEWTRVGTWTEAVLDQLAESGAEGAWKAGTWIASPDEWTAAEVTAALRGAPSDVGTRRFAAYDAPVQSAPGASEPTSFLTSREVGSFLCPPRASSPGIAVRASPPASRRPVTGERSLAMGSYWGTSMPAAIGIDDLEGHVFVTGSTGAGKTTTLHRLLSEAWNKHRVPFLVIDPVKDDYSGAASAFDGGLQVVTGKSLSLDLMRPNGADSAQDHLVKIAQAFRGAFSMPSPTPYVVTQVFDRIIDQPGGPEGTTLFDVRDVVDTVVSGLGYAPEAESNIRASLLTRLELLLAPARAQRFVWPDATMVDSLLQRPSVVTLADLVDDEERSFLVLVLALAVWAKARARSDGRPVAHLLVLEEAHRVLPEVRPDAPEDAGTARRASAELLTAMLAEVRSHGEQVVVVDQSPSRVASDVIRNTNTKLVHRVVAPEDQRTMAAAVGVPAEDAGLFGAPARGQVVVSTRRLSAPQTIAFPVAPPGVAAAGARPVQRSSPRWPCCAGRSPERHFRAWRANAAAEVPMALFLIGARLGVGDGGDDLRDGAAATLLAAERSLASRSSCLAWSGLRRLLVAERRTGVLASAAAVDDQLAHLYAMWASEHPATHLTAHRLGVPRTGLATTCPDCGTSCGVRVPAGVLTRSGPRTGPAALASVNWRSELSGVEDWARGEIARLTALTGPTGARTVVRCQIHQVVRRHRLPSDVADLLIRRAGLGTKETV